MDSYFLCFWEYEKLGSLSFVPYTSYHLLFFAFESFFHFYFYLVVAYCRDMEVLNYERWEMKDIKNVLKQNKSNIYTVRIK